jgi:hypothetical protein
MARLALLAALLGLLARSCAAQEEECTDSRERSFSRCCRQLGPPPGGARTRCPPPAARRPFRLLSAAACRQQPRAPLPVSYGKGAAKPPWHREVDPCGHNINQFFLSQIRPTHPRRIINLRSDIGDRIEQNSYIMP